MKELEKRINEENGPKEIKLSGKMHWKIEQGRVFTIGRFCMRGLIEIARPDITIDGSNAEIEVEVTDSTWSDLALFFILPTANNVKFKNLRVKVRVHNSEHSTRLFSIVYNSAFGLQLEGCSLEAYADKQITLTGIYNNGNLDTHLETRADNLVIINCLVKVEELIEEYPEENAAYGLYNNLANSISVQNTFIYAINRGIGEKQKAIGVYTNGRFGRFVGNNIKANATHNEGKLKEQAYAFGFVNEGLYTIITSNNIVGEWSGMSVGLENKGEYARIGSNKILATHTICGRSIRNYANNCVIEGNILTSTSRNARLIELNAGSCIISGNLMEVLMPIEECRSGCGIYAVGDGVTQNIISGNIIRNVANVGIFANADAGLITNNQVNSYTNTIKQAGTANTNIAAALNENKIKSI